MLALDANTISYYFRGDPQVAPRRQALDTLLRPCASCRSTRPARMKPRPSAPNWNRAACPSARTMC
ncbi:hypothetical protein PY257_10550 [Ramlibacter sp. H39-3-26]|uniref:hypothetical protein n=1 Tax=Curvibacter soli TaxID=3031331 RepID=UPI0023D9B58C|nr:hypothetical protein [Ramlibacter sp. H39-3-26]MDF1485613.1 hypothetical protein [Ramlibacter sp. H39-3-26]